MSRFLPSPAPTALLIELAAPLALALPRLGAAALPRMTLPP